MEPTSSSWKDHAFIIRLITIVLLAAIVIVALVRDRIVSQPYEQVTVVGEGRISYVPDTAVVTLGVQTLRSSTAEAALENINTRITRILEAVTALGIAEEDIQTQNLSLYPEYDYVDGRSIPSGYTGNQQVAIKVKNIVENVELVSQVIDAASKAGANQINGVSFEVSNLSELRQEARIAAIADAKEKSKELAKASGVRLGKIMGWYENMISPPPQPYYDGLGYGGDKGGANPQVPSGLQEVVVEMNVSYKIR